MPDRAKLRIGDRIRLLAVPEFDLRQRDREVLTGLEDAGWTADTIERILAQQPVVAISKIDELGLAWFDVELQGRSGKPEYHSLVVIDDDSWEYVQ